jgi:hypothetical protein
MDGSHHVQGWLGHANVSTTRVYDHRKTRPEDSPTFKIKYQSGFRLLARSAHLSMHKFPLCESRALNRRIELRLFRNRGESSIRLKPDPILGSVCSRRPLCRNSLTNVRNERPITRCHEHHRLLYCRAYATFNLHGPANELCTEHTIRIAAPLGCNVSIAFRTIFLRHKQVDTSRLHIEIYSSNL